MRAILAAKPRVSVERAADRARFMLTIRTHAFVDDVIVGTRDERRLYWSLATAIEAGRLVAMTNPYLEPVPHTTYIREELQP